MSAFVYDPTLADFPTRAFAIYRELRDHHPVYRHPEQGFYTLSRFEDVRWASQQSDLFSSEATQTAVEGLPQLQALDPPYHDELRGLVSSAFTPRRVAALEGRIRAMVTQRIDAFAARGHCDLLADFARSIPNQVISEMIGIPRERQPAFLELALSLLEADAGGASHAEKLRPAAEKIGEEFAQLLEQRRRAPADDLMSSLAAVDLAGRRLRDEEILGFCFVLVSAGSDTTANLFVNGAVRLAEHPEQRSRLVAEPVRIPAAIEEMLRYDAPAQLLWRVARRDIQRHGVTIPAGAEVRLLWGAANHDEREFAEPERFDVFRNSPRHLAFGVGSHFCLGANLARLEARVMFEEFLSRIPGYELVAAPEWLPSVWARAYRGVPVRFAPAALPLREGRAPVGGVGAGGR